VLPTPIIKIIKNLKTLKKPQVLKEKHIGSR